jgi:hypothetical protein
LIASLLVGLWLFLPPFDWPLGPVSLRKTELVRWVPLLIGLVAVPRAFLRWHWLDLPILLYCLCPFLSGVINGLPWANSAWETVKEFSYWWVPFAVGRFLITDENERNAVAWVVIAGAILYLPPTLYEIFYGPNLANWATGQEFGRMLRGADRGGTFRPSVFLSSGFVLTMFYVWAVLLAAKKTELGMVNWFFPPLQSETISPPFHRCLWQAILTLAFATTVLLCRSLGSIVLMAVGLASQFLLRGRLGGIALALLVLIPPVYIGLRTTGMASTNRIYNVTRKITSETRAGSLRYRLQAEDIVFDSMAGHTVWGYGNWGQWREGRDAMVLDGFWLFTWTRTGMVCVAAWWAMVAIPVLLLAVKTYRNGSLITNDMVYPCSLFLGLSLVDSMFNYFGEAPVMMCVGMVTALAKDLVCRKPGS